MNAALPLILAGQEFCKSISRLITIIATDNPIFYERTTIRHDIQYQSGYQFICLLVTQSDISQAVFNICIVLCPSRSSKAVIFSVKSV